MGRRLSMDFCAVALLEKDSNQVRVESEEGRTRGQTSTTQQFRKVKAGQAFQCLAFRHLCL